MQRNERDFISIKKKKKLSKNQLENRFKSRERYANFFLYVYTCVSRCKCKNSSAVGQAFETFERRRTVAKYDFHCCRRALVKMGGRENL